jgi:hypothetical protein
VSVMLAFNARYDSPLRARPNRRETVRKQIGLLMVAASLAFGLAPGDCEAANLSRLLGAQRPVAQASAEPMSPGATSIRTALSARSDRTTPSSQTQLRATPRYPILRLILLYLLWNGYN